jgi:AcrR family transcriptional regulator
MIVQHESLLEIATRVLLAEPTASLGDIAKAAGLSRTSLHARFPTRHSLLVALAHEAMDLVAKAYVEARLDTEGEDVEPALRRLLTLAVPLGPRMEFLLRERSLDAESEIVARYEALDRPLIDLVSRGQRAGRLRADLPAWWVAAALLGTIYAAWEAVADGRLAPRDAPDLVLTTVLHGAGPRQARHSHLEGAR